MKRLPRPLATIVGAAVVVCATVSVAGAGGGTDAPPPAAPPAATRDLHTNSQPDLHYVPLSPCRIVDTRGHGGAMTNAERTFAVAGNLATQGGAADCDIPADAETIAANVTAISAGGSTGYVRGRATNEDPATTTLLNFSPALNATNMTNQPIDEDGFRLAVAGSANLVVDVVGYYTAPYVVTVRPNGTVYAGSNGVVSATRSGPGAYSLVLTRDASYCSPSVSTYDTNSYATITTYSAKVVDVRTWTLASGHEVPTDQYFQATITC